MELQANHPKIVPCMANTIQLRPSRKPMTKDPKYQTIPTSQTQIHQYNNLNM